VKSTTLDRWRCCFEVN